jgi:hypothetical protein
MTGFLPKPPFISGINRSHPLARGITGAWPFTEQNINNFTDHSGRGNHGTGLGTPLIINSTFGRGVDISTTNTRISVGDPASGDFSMGDGSSDIPFTIYTCLTPNATGVNKVLISKDGTPREWLLYNQGASTIALFIYDNSSNSIRIGRTGNGLIAGVVSHVFAVYDGSSTNGGIKLYINGLRIDTNDSGSGSYTATGNKVIGCAIAGFAGGGLAIDSTQHNTIIWKNRQLSVTEMMSLVQDSFQIYRRPSKISEWIGGTVVAPDVGNPYYYYSQQRAVVGC